MLNDEKFISLFDYNITAFYDIIGPKIDDLAQDIVDQFKAICRRSKTICPFSIAVLDFTLLRTNILHKKYVTEVMAYGSEHFFDKDAVTLGWINISRVFEGYELLYDVVSKETKKYIGKMSSYDVSSFMMTKAMEFYKVFTFLMRRHIMKFIELPEFKDVPVAEEYEINCGEYAAYTETIYSKRIHKKEEEERKNLKILSACNFMEFREVDFSGEHLKNLDLRYSDFSQCKFINTKFQQCRLDFSRFHKINAADSQFYNVDLNGSDFTKAKLQRSSFVNITNQNYYDIQECGVPFVKEYEISFRNADLSGAAFQNSNLSNVDFSNAIMNNVIMDKLGRNTSRLSNEQIGNCK